MEMNPWDSELISLLPPSCHIYAAGGAGYDWVDANALGSRGIWYANAAGAGDEATSDLALYLILSVFRCFTQGQLAARTANAETFNTVHDAILNGNSRNPSGHVLGVVGFGGIGKKLAYKAHAALGMEIHYYDVVRASPEVEKQTGNAVYHSDLPSLLAISDCISLHAPLNEYTRNLINTETIGMMKPGARLINTSRGQVVEEGALVNALKTGKLAAAGIDVHYHEPQVSRELAAMENVTLTPHLGGVAIETVVGFEMTAMKNIIAVVGDDGSMVGEPSTPVNARVVRKALEDKVRG